MGSMCDAARKITRCRKRSSVTECSNQSFLGIILSAAAYNNFITLSPCCTPFKVRYLPPIRERPEHRRDPGFGRGDWLSIATRRYPVASSHSVSDIDCPYYRAPFPGELGHRLVGVFASELNLSEFSIPTEYAEEACSVMTMISQNLEKKAKVERCAVLTDAFATGECSPSSAASVIAH